MKNRAQTKEQKQEVIQRLASLWDKNKDLRLSQLLLNVFQRDFYYVEDFELIDALEDYYKE